MAMAYTDICSACYACTEYMVHKVEAEYNKVCTYVFKDQLS